MKNYYTSLALSLLLVISQLQAQSSFEKWIGGNYGGDIATKIIPAADGGYIVIGSWTIDYGQTWDTETDAVIIKIDESGNLVWRKTIPTVARYTNADQFKGITPTQDGGYIAVGVIQTANDVGKEDVLIAKFTVSGDTVWTKRYNIAAYDCGNSIVPAGDGGYIIAGKCGPLGNDNILFLKVNASGDTLWTRTWGDAYEDRLNDVIASGDGNFYVVGCMKKTTYPYTLWDYIIKFTTTGDTLWTKRLVSGEAMTISSTSDGGYIIAEKEALVKVDANFDEVWRKSKAIIFGLYGGNIRSAIPVSGGYVAVGKSDDPDPSYNQQLFFAKFNTTGDTAWTRRFGVGTSNKADEGFSVVQTIDGGYLAVGFTNKNTSQDIYLVKVNSNGVVAVYYQRGDNPKNFALEQNYPNPFNPSTTINYQLSVTSNVKLSVFDLLGRKITTLVHEVQTAGAHHITFDAHALSSGMYFYKLTAGNFTQVKKMMLTK